MATLRTGPVGFCIRYNKSSAVTSGKLEGAAEQGDRSKLVRLAAKKLGFTEEDKRQLSLAV